MGDTGPFSVGEKVMVPHTDKYYEAKVLKAEFREDGQWYYFLHYTGWNKKWDEWVEETGLSKCAQTGPTGAANSIAAPSGGGGAKKARIAGGGGGGGFGGGFGGGGRQRPVVAASGALAPLPLADFEPAHIDLELPALLKKQLLDDHDAIHEDSKLVPLPRKPSAGEVLDAYLESTAERRAAAGGGSGGTLEGDVDLVAGVRMYFDKALQHCLLYAREKPQAQLALQDGRIPSSIYGAEHLLRLFIKMPELMPRTGLSDAQLGTLATRLEEILRFMQANHSKFFVPRNDYATHAASMAALKLPGEPEPPVAPPTEPPAPPVALPAAPAVPAAPKPEPAVAPAPAAEQAAPAAVSAAAPAAEAEAEVQPEVQAEAAAAMDEEAEAPGPAAEAPAPAAQAAAEEPRAAEETAAAAPEAAAAEEEAAAATAAAPADEEAAAVAGAPGGEEQPGGDAMEEDAPGGGEDVAMADEAAQQGQEQEAAGGDAGPELAAAPLEEAPAAAAVAPAAES